MKWSPRYVARWDRPRGRNLSGHLGKPAFRGASVSWPDYDLGMVVEYWRSPVFMVTFNRRDRADVWIEAAREYGYGRVPDLGAFTEFTYDLEPGELNRYASFDRLVLQSVFDSPIAEPGIRAGRVGVVEFRGDDTPEYRRFSVAMGFMSFLHHLPASGTAWHGYAVGPKLIVLDKRKRIANRPLIDFALVGERFDLNDIVTGEYVEAQDGAGGPGPWNFFLRAVANRFDVIELAMAAPYAEMATPNVRARRGRLLICAGRKGPRSLWPREEQESLRAGVFEWEVLLRKASGLNWIREELTPGRVRFHHPDTAAALKKNGGGHAR